jgi:acyl-coenzyme A synthetase/AMP-(fatty) acid ligase
MDKFAPAEFAELVRRFAIRSTILPPAAMAELADSTDVTDLTPLRYVRSITAPLSPLQAQRFTEKFGVTVLNSYGQAEVGEVIGWTAADAKEHPEKVGAIGKPHAGVDIKIVDDAGTPVAAGAVARLLVRPPRMAAGYADGSMLADRIDADGFVDTGDLARIDDDGFVWLEGRASDMINRGGNKIFPDEVEEVLRLSPAVREVAVVGVHNARLGEVPVAFLVGDPQPSGELEQLCREHLVPYKVPVSFHYVDALPRSEVGKVLRRELSARKLS